ncbi:MAG: hypothetical protein RI637_00780 [Acidimicrobiia bacterium]|nr:hypothetical protein [Acidimicrobiia bacterium]
MEHVLGPASIRRIGMLAHPVAVFESQDGSPEGKVLARLGRDGWFRVFFGRGRRVELPDGTAWRVAAIGAGGCIVPVVLCERGKLAVAAAHGTRSYGINGRDYAYNLYRQSRAGLRHSTWSLREHDTVLATFRLHSMFADHPVPLAAALLGFTLIKYGVPGEADSGVPQFRWG